MYYLTYLALMAEVGFPSLVRCRCELVWGVVWFREMLFVCGRGSRGEVGAGVRRCGVVYEG